jgi:hypothetical protein
MMNIIQDAKRKRVLQMLDLFNSKYDCKVCRKKLRYKADQIVHYKLKHAGGDLDHCSSDKLKCPYCCKEHTSYFKLTSHIMVDHLNEKPYGCRVCKKKFYSFLKFKRHCHKSHSAINLLNLIEYDNSELILVDNKYNDSTNYDKSTFEQNQIKPMVDKINDNSPSYFTTNAQIKYTKFLDKIRLSEIIVKPNYIEISDNKLNNTNYHDIFPNVKSKTTKSINNSFQHYQEEDTESESMDLETKSIDEHVFTIITQFNLQKCPKCTKLFMTNSEFLNHMWKFHMLNGERPTKFECWSCYLNYQHNKNNSNSPCYKFNNEIELITHLKSSAHIDELPYKCSLCTNSFSDLNSAQLHYYQTHLLNENDIENGLIINNNENEFDNRIKYKFVFACSNCEQIYHDHDSIIEHFIKYKECNLNSYLSLNKKMKLLKCESCNEKYSNESTLNIHLDQHEYLERNLINDEEQLSPPPIIKKPSRIFEIKNNNNNSHNYLNNNNNNFNYLNNTTNNNSNNIHCIFNNNNNNTNNIHNSLNNRSFSIDAIVNSAKMNNNNIGRKYDNPTRLNLKPNLRLNTQNMIQSYQTSSDNLILVNRHNHPSSAFRVPEKTVVKKDMINIDNCQNEFEDLNHDKLLGIPLLSRHQSSILPITLNYIQRTSHVCYLCFYMFNNETELQQHKMDHIGSNKRRPMLCHLCKVSFNKKELLRKHMYIHEFDFKERGFVCPICVSTFSRKQDLDRHLLFHRKK